MASVGRSPAGCGPEKKLFKYCAQGRVKKIQQLLELDTSIPVDICNSKGQTLLYVSCLYGHTKTAVLLLQYGADPNKRSEDGSTPTHAAAYSCSVELLQYIVEKGGGDMRLHDELFRTPKDWALAAGRKVNKKVLQVINSWQRSVDQDIKHSYQANCENKMNSSSSLLGSKRNQEHEVALNKSFVACQGYGKFLRLSTGSSCSRDVGLAAVLPLASPAEFTSPDNEPSLLYRSPPSFVMEGALWCGHSVTIKRLKANESRTSVKVEEDLLITEANSNSHLRHPHLLLLMSVCLTSSSDSYACSPLHWLVYEPVSIGSLHHLLHKKHTAILLSDAIRFMVQISDALMYMHERGFIHCAVTSHAVHLTTPLSAKLGDLSYVCHIDEKATPPSPVASTYNRWLAPEVILNKPVSSSTDTYSFCHVVAEAISGVLPWAGYDCESIKEHVMSKHNYSSLPNCIPGPLKPVLAKGLRSAAHKRMVRIKDVSFSLRSLLQDENFGEIQASLYRKVSRHKNATLNESHLGCAPPVTAYPTPKEIAEFNWKITSDTSLSSTGSLHGLDVPDSAPIRDPHPGKQENLHSVQAARIHNISQDIETPLPQYQDLPFNQYPHSRQNNNQNLSANNSRRLSEIPRNEYRQESDRLLCFPDGRASAPILSRMTYPDLSERILTPGEYVMSGVSPEEASRFRRMDRLNVEQSNQLGRISNPRSYSFSCVEGGGVEREMRNRDSSYNNLTDDDKGSTTDIRPNADICQPGSSTPPEPPGVSDCVQNQGRIQSSAVNDSQSIRSPMHPISQLPPKPVRRRPHMMTTSAKENTTVKCPISDEQPVVRFIHQTHTAQNNTQPKRFQNLAAEHPRNGRSSITHTSVERVRSASAELSSMLNPPPRVSHPLHATEESMIICPTRPLSCNSFMRNHSLSRNTPLIKSSGSCTSPNEESYFTQTDLQDFGISPPVIRPMNCSSHDHQHQTVIPHRLSMLKETPPNTNDQEVMTVRCNEIPHVCREHNHDNIRDSAFERGIDSTDYSSYVNDAGPESVRLSGEEILQSRSPPSAVYSPCSMENHQDLIRRNSGAIPKKGRTQLGKPASTPSVRYQHADQANLHSNSNKRNHGRYISSPSLHPGSRDVADDRLNLQYCAGGFQDNVEDSGTQPNYEEMKTDDEYTRNQITQPKNPMITVNKNPTSCGIGDRSEELGITKPSRDDEITKGKNYGRNVERKMSNEGKILAPSARSPGTQVQSFINEDCYEDLHRDPVQQYLSSASDEEVAKIFQENDEDERKFSIGSGDLEEIFGDFAERRSFGILRKVRSKKKSVGIHITDPNPPPPGCYEDYSQYDIPVQVKDSTGNSFNEEGKYENIPLQIHTRRDDSYDGYNDRNYDVPDSRPTYFLRRSVGDTNLPAGSNERYIDEYSSDLIRDVMTQDAAYQGGSVTETWNRDVTPNVDVITHFCDEFGYNSDHCELEADIVADSFPTPYATNWTQTGNQVISTKDVSTSCLELPRYEYLTQKENNEDKHINGEAEILREVRYNKSSQTHVDPLRNLEEEDILTGEKDSSISFNFITCLEEKDESKLSANDLQESSEKVYASVGTSPIKLKRDFNNQEQTGQNVKLIKLKEPTKCSRGNNVSEFASLSTGDRVEKRDFNEQTIQLDLVAAYSQTDEGFKDQSQVKPVVTNVKSSQTLDEMKPVQLCFENKASNTVETTTPSKWSFKKKLSVFEDVASKNEGLEPCSVRCLLSKEKKSKHEKMIHDEKDSSDDEVTSDYDVIPDMEHDVTPNFDAAQKKLGNIDQATSVTPKNATSTWLKNNVGIKTSTPVTQSDLLSKNRPEDKVEYKVTNSPRRFAEIRANVEAMSSPILKCGNTLKGSKQHCKFSSGVTKTENAINDDLKQIQDTELQNVQISKTAKLPIHAGDLKSKENKDGGLTNDVTKCTEKEVHRAPSSPRLKRGKRLKDFRRLRNSWSPENVMTSPRKNDAIFGDVKNAQDKEIVIKNPTCKEMDCKMHNRNRWLVCSSKSEELPKLKREHPFPSRPEQLGNRKILDEVSTSLTTVTCPSTFDSTVEARFSTDDGTTGSFNQAFQEICYSGQSDGSADMIDHLVDSIIDKVLCRIIEVEVHHIEMPEDSTDQQVVQPSVDDVIVSESEDCWMSADAGKSSEKKKDDVISERSKLNDDDVIGDDSYEVEKYIEDGIDALAEHIVENEINGSLHGALTGEFNRIFGNCKENEDISVEKSSDSDYNNNFKIDPVTHDVITDDVDPNSRQAYDSEEQGQDFTSLMMDSEYDGGDTAPDSVSTSVWSDSMRQNSLDTDLRRVAMQRNIIIPDNAD